MGKIGGNVLRALKKIKLIPRIEGILFQIRGPAARWNAVIVRYGSPGGAPPSRRRSGTHARKGLAVDLIDGIYYIRTG